MIRNTKILGIAARRLGVPVILAEQDPEGLGRTLPELRGLLDGVATRPSNEQPSPAAVSRGSRIGFASSRLSRSSSWASRRTRACCSPRSISSASGF
jgi:hypothetical protein